MLQRRLQKTKIYLNKEKEIFMNQTKRAIKIPTSSVSWSKLYRWAAQLSTIMLLLIPLQIIIFVVSPPPVTVVGYFQLYHTNWLLGLFSLDLIYIFNNIILIFIYAALFVRLFDENPSICLAALLIGIVGIASYFPSNPAFEMLTLSSKYWLALPSVQNQYLAAGEALMAGYIGTSFDVYYILNAITLLLFSTVILKSSHFSKRIGLFGMVSGLLMIVPSSAGLIGMVFSLLSLIPWIVFLFLLIRRFHIFSKCVIV
jgi:hypothetical protein